MTGDDTIFALASGQPPAAIAIVRVSGEAADEVLLTLAGRLPEPRRATLALLRTPAAEPLDRALVLWFPGPESATGEDVAELHLHGGRAVVAAVLAALAALPGCRAATPGEFTRRAFTNGVIDLAQAEALGDLLAAETEQQRRRAIRGVEGEFAATLSRWRDELIGIAAEIEAELDFSGEDDVATTLRDPRPRLRALAAEMGRSAALVPVDRLRDGVRVVIAGPPNSGKSSLLNALAGQDVAIVSPVAGTTRDRIELPVVLGGTSIRLVDTAGLRDTADEVERCGIDRARDAIGGADLLLWLGAPRDCPMLERRVVVQALSDLPERRTLHPGADIATSIHDPGSIDRLRILIRDRSATLLPPEDQTIFGTVWRKRVQMCEERLHSASKGDALECVAAEIGDVLRLLDEHSANPTDAVRDAIFLRFCIGK